MRNLVVIFLASAALSGCNAAYQRPATADNSASIRFVASQHKGWNSSMSVYAHAGEACGTPKKIVGFGGGIFNFGGGSKKEGDIGMLKDPATAYAPGQFYETTVEAGKPFHFTVSGAEKNGVCYVSGSFFPQIHSQYEVTYTTTSDYCYLRVDRIAAEDARVTRVKETSAQQRTKSCTFFWN